nr:hypothetical protein TetV2_00545 [Oceanusvirus sp.]
MCGPLGWPRLGAMCADLNLRLKANALTMTEGKQWFAWLHSCLWPRFRGDDARLDAVLSEESSGEVRNSMMAAFHCDPERLVPDKTIPRPTPFVFMRPKLVDFHRLDMDHVMFLLPEPVGWVRANRTDGGSFAYMEDGEPVSIDQSELQKRCYATTWAVSDLPFSKKPPLAPPVDLNAKSVTWCVYSPGVEGWVLAERKDGRWFQRCGGIYSEQTVIQDVPDGEYGETYGAVASPIPRHISQFDPSLYTDRPVERLVAHPVYVDCWMPVVKLDGRYFCPSYPEYLPVDASFSNRNYNVTWRFPPG